MNLIQLRDERFDSTKVHYLCLDWAFRHLHVGLQLTIIIVIIILIMSVHIFISEEWADLWQRNVMGGTVLAQNLHRWEPVDLQ